MKGKNFIAAHICGVKIEGHACPYCCFKSNCKGPCRLPNGFFYVDANLL